METAFQGQGSSDLKNSHQAHLLEAIIRKSLITINVRLGDPSPQHMGL